MNPTINQLKMPMLSPLLYVRERVAASTRILPLQEERETANGAGFACVLRT